MNAQKNISFVEINGKIHFLKGNVMQIFTFFILSQKSLIFSFIIAIIEI